MTRRNTIPEERIIEILSDGEWHDLCEFISLSREFVTPEHASRSFIVFTKNRPTDYEIDQMIARGRQYCIEERLRQLSRRGVLTMEGSGYKKRYRSNVVSN